MRIVKITPHWSVANSRYTPAGYIAPWKYEIQTARNTYRGHAYYWHSVDGRAEDRVSCKLNEAVAVYQKFGTVPPGHL